MSFLHVVNIVEGGLAKREKADDGGPWPPVKEKPRGEKKEVPAPQKPARPSAKDLEGIIQVQKSNEANSRAFDMFCKSVEDEAAPRFKAQVVPLIDSLIRYFDIPTAYMRDKLALPVSFAVRMATRGRKNIFHRYDAEYVYEETKQDLDYMADAYCRHGGASPHDDLVFNGVLHTAIKIGLERGEACCCNFSMKDVEEYLRNDMWQILSQAISSGKAQKNIEHFRLVRELMSAMLDDPELTPEVYFDGVVQTVTAELPEGNALSLADKARTPLEIEVPLVPQAARQIVKDMRDLRGDKAGESLIVTFGAEARKKAGDAALAIQRWKLEQSAELPASIRVMQRMTERAQQMRAFVEAQGQRRDGLRGWFRREEKPDYQAFYQLAASFIRETSGVSQLADGDLARFKGAIDEDRRAGEVLAAHAKIVSLYRDAFNKEARGLKMRAITTHDRKQIARFKPESIRMTAAELQKTVLRAQQAAAEFMMPESTSLQEYYARITPDLSWQSADIMRAAEQVLRIVRLRELAALYRQKNGDYADKRTKVGPADVRRFASLAELEQIEELRAAMGRLEKSMEPWAQTTCEVEQILQIENANSAVLLLEYRPEDAAPLHINIAQPKSKPEPV